MFIFKSQDGGGGWQERQRKLEVVYCAWMGANQDGGEGCQLRDGGNKRKRRKRSILSHV